jgi:hypothetical protein
MNGVQPTGSLTYHARSLGYLFGQGIVHLRQADPAALNAAFAEFFADNGAYFAQLSQALGMSLQDSLLPIIMSAPARESELFNTIVECSESRTPRLSWRVDFVALPART